jgi:hypothetical protein
VDGLNEYLGRCLALRSWAQSRGLALSGGQQHLELPDREIGEQPDSSAMMVPAGEVGLFLGTVIINSMAGERWRLWRRETARSSGWSPSRLISRTEAVRDVF